jgi:uroporphyrinogen decarboxylase
MISITGDIAMQDRIIMGPEAWRRVDKPRMADLIRACRAVNPEVFFFIHSDGNVSDLMDDLIEIGFNVINPIQPECMDPVEVKKRWGDKITIHGGVSLQRTLPNGTPEEVRAEVESLIRQCGYNGGLVVFPSNVIQPDTSVENIVACFHSARDIKPGGG